MGGGMKEFEARYIDNGILDFLLSEREEGAKFESLVAM